MSRLPVVSGDTGTWGTVLNDFLGVAHYGDGSLKNSVVMNTHTGSYTLALGDAGSLVAINSAVRSTVTIPAVSTVAFPIGTAIQVVQDGTGTVILKAATGVTLNSVGGALALVRQYAKVLLVQRSSNVWTITGDLSTTSTPSLTGYLFDDFSFYPSRWTITTGTRSFSGGIMTITTPAGGEVQPGRTVRSTILRDFDTIRLDVDLKGFTFTQAGDTPVFGFDINSQWRTVNLLNFAVNGMDGWQSLSIPISKFTSGMDATPVANGTGTVLLHTELVERVFARIWASSAQSLAIRNIRFEDRTGTIVQDFTQPVNLVTVTTSSTKQWRLQGLDLMKITKDNAYDRPTDARIAQVISACQALNPTHLALAIPYDDASMYSPPASEDGSAYALRWATPVHSAGLNVFWRQMAGEWEGIYSFPVNVTRPPGTAAGVASGTEPTSYLQQIYNYIVANPAQYAAGDIICPTPEPNQISGVAGSAPYHFQNASDYRKWLRDNITVCNMALDRIGLRGKVAVGFYGISDFLVNGNTDNPRGFLDDRTIDAMTVLGVDSYPNPASGITTVLNTYETLYGKKPLAITEWGTINETTDVSRQAAVDAYLGDLRTRPYIYGFSYWTTTSGANENLLDPTTLAPIGAYARVQDFFTV
jgi:hypothetical protein